MMIKLIAAALVLTGVSLGTYAALSGRHADTQTFQPAGLATAVASIVKGRPAPAAVAPGSPKTVTTAELSRIPVALQAHARPAPADTVTIAREMQLQLKRVGCYEGLINGVWSPSVIHAMKAFADHVNAALPMGHPDIVL
jgi:hypothetical protein